MDLKRMLKAMRMYNSCNKLKKNAKRYHDLLKKSNTRNKFVKKYYIYTY